MPKYDYDYDYGYSYYSSNDSYYPGFGSGYPADKDDGRGEAQGPDSDFKTLITENSNFRPFRIRYILDGTDTKKVAACSMNQYMEDAYDSSFTYAEYFGNKCDKNGGDVSNLYDTNWGDRAQKRHRKYLQSLVFLFLGCVYGASLGFLSKGDNVQLEPVSFLILMSNFTNLRLLINSADGLPSRAKSDKF